jgi:hypothetical protein
LHIVIQRFLLQAGKPFLAEAEGQVRCCRHNQPGDLCALVLGHAELLFPAVARSLGLRKPDLKITDAFQVLPHGIRCTLAVLGQDFCPIPLLKLVHLITGPLQACGSNALFLVHSHHHTPSEDLRRLIPFISPLLANILHLFCHLQSLHPKIFARIFLCLLQSQ